MMILKALGRGVIIGLADVDFGNMYMVFNWSFIILNLRCNFDVAHRQHTGLRLNEG